MTRIERIRSENTTFVNNFWGHRDSGFRVIQTKIKHALTTLEELLDFYKERIQIEKDYNKRLEKLNGKILLGSRETGSLKKSLDKLALENKHMVKDNSKFIRSLTQTNYDKLNHFYSIYYKKVSKIELHMQKIINKQNDLFKTLEMNKNRYQEECSQIKSLRLLVQTTWGKELEKNENKLNKIVASNANTKKHYQNAVTNFTDLNEIFVRDWAIALKDFYQLEVERIQICKVNCFTFCNNIATLCVDNDQSVDLARSVFALVSPPQDLQEFGDAYGTGDKMYNPPVFVDFMNGYDDGQRESEFTRAEFENPDNDQLLSRSYSSFSQGTQRSSPTQEVTAKAPLPLVKETLEKANLPLPPANDIPISAPNGFLGSPTRKPPAGFDRTNSVYSAQDKNDVFSVGEKEKIHKFTNSNGSSNYSNPTNYTGSNYSGSSNTERNWASPRRKEKQLTQFQEQINLKSKELPSFPHNPHDTNETAQNVPIIKDFSIDFIAKALEDLNSGGDGDINQYRRSVRGTGNHEESRAKTAPSTPFGKMKTHSDFINDRDEIATRHDSIMFSSPTRNQNIANMDGSPVKGRRQRPKSMLDPLSNDRLSDYQIADHMDQLVDTCIIKKPNDQFQSPNKKPQRSLLRSPTKSYTNLNAMIQQPSNSDLTSIGNTPYISKAKALYTYKPQDHGELYFKKGWFMYIIHKQEDNWFVCELAQNCNDRAGMVGLVPGNYLSEGGQDLF
ncbi:uncharacterized protein AC631_03989 [Debaryomyces fabryi]|uniref:Septation protein imp2 n=1 Tax=Debaryomyces fabryi TaxID=58627 RepID=A0A0V1PVQ3_9ASCO|nr:uncharacterized protein AC631_03989 [Debaryomyces fabryi]KSA00242.1 hypothetical protein AC631_03989 [Debaryomyces fabryi]CUM46358.1 unnamed protein product [Debaryomyces fabryi]